MSIKRLVPLNTASLANDPSTARTGDIYYNNVLSQLRYFDGTNWIVIAGSTNGLVNAKSIYQDVRNQSGVDMAVATPVYISSAIGASSKMLVTAASNSAESTSSKTMGLTTTAISNNSNGQVISEGLLENVDTTGANDGDPVWLGVNGAKIYGLANKPSAPAHLVFLGIVIRGGSVNTGSIYVKIQNGFELHELHNVEVSSLVNGNILAYDSTTQTWKNTNTLQSTSSTTPLVVKASASQSVDIFQIQNSSGNPIFYVNQYNQLIGNQPIYQYNTLYLGSPATSAIPLTVRGAASQTANLQEWQDSTGANLALMTSGGFLHGTGFRIKQNANSTISSAQGSIEIQGPTVRGLVIVAATSQTANLQEWQNSSGTVLTSISSGGNLVVGATGTLISYASGRGIFALGDPASVGLTVKGAASQTANLQEWQNSAGTILAKILSNGGATFTGNTWLQAGLRVQGNYGGSNTMDIVNNQNIIGLTIKGNSTQTADLQQWQDSSSTVLASIIANGNLRGFAGLYGTNSAGTANYPLFVTNSVASTTVAVIKGAASQTANLQEWQNSAGYAGTAIDSGGSFYAPGIYASYLMQVTAGGAAVVPMTIKGAASQTADYFQIQNSNGTVLAQLNSSNQFNVNYGSIYAPYGIRAGSNNHIGLASVSAFSTNAAYLALGVKAYLGQTADLVQNQNSSGTVLSGINAAGQIYIGSGSSAGGSSYALTAATAASATAATFTHAQTTQPFVVGQQVIISGVTPTYFNGTWTVTATGGTSGAYTFTVLGSGFTASGIGTAFGTFRPSAQLSVSSLNALMPAIVAQAVAGQTAVLVDFLSSTGGRVASIGATGGAYFAGGVSTNFGSSLIGSAIQDPYQTGSIINMGYASGNTNNTGTIRVQSRFANQLPLTIKGSTGGNNSITGATANGTTITYTSGQSQFFVAGQTVNITGIVSTGNPGATAGSGFNLTNATIASASTNQFTVTNSLTDTYTSGGTFTGTGQYADLTQWQDSSGTVKASVSNIGNIQAGTYNGVIVGLNYPGIVLDTSVTDNTQVWLRNLSASTKSGRFVGIKARNGYADAVSGDDLVTLAGQQYSSGVAQDAGKILISNDSSTPTSTSYPARITFHTTAIGSTTLTERMRIDNSGLVGINMTPTDAYLSVTGSSSKDAIRVYSQGGNLAFWGGGINNNLYTNGNMYMTGGSWAGTTKLAVDTGGASYNGIVIRGVSGQTANLQEWQDSAGTLLTSITPSGDLNFSSNLWNIKASGTNVIQWQPSTGSTFLSYGSSNTPITIQGSSGQTGDLQKWTNSSGTVLAKIAADGQLSVGNGTSNYLSTYDAYGNITSRTAGTNYGANISVLTGSTSYIGMVIRGLSSQTANLQEWQNSSGTVITKIDANGAIDSTIQITGRSAVTAGTGNYLSASLSVIPLNASIVGAVIRGYASQSANLQEWQNSSGTILSLIDSAGRIFTREYLTVERNAGAGSTVLAQNWAWNGGANWGFRLNQVYSTSPSGSIDYHFVTRNNSFSTDTNVMFIKASGLVGFNIINQTSAQVFINNSTAANVGLIVKGAASQTANLQEWQDSSGNVLAGINSTGSLSLAAGKQVIFGSYIGTKINLGYEGAYQLGIDDYTIALEVDNASNIGKVAVRPSSATYGTSYANPIELYANGQIKQNLTVASNVGLIIKSAASQTADLTQWQNSLGAVVAKIDSNAIFNALNSGSGVDSYSSIVIGGRWIRNEQRSSLTRFGVNTGEWHMATNPDNSVIAITDNQVGVFATSTTLPLFIVKGAANQTANLQEWQDSAGTVQAYIGANGFINTNNSVRIAGDNLSVYRFQGVSDGNYTMNFPGSGNIQLFSATNDTGSGVGVLGIKNATTAPTSNPTTGGILYVSSGALLYRGTSNASQQIVGADGSVKFTSPAASIVPLIIQHASSPSSSYFEIRNSAGNPIWGINSSGEALTRTTTKFGANIQNDSNNNNNSLSLSAPSSSGTGIPLYIYSGSTTRDMVKFDNSGVVKLTITSDGSLKGGNSNTISVNTASTVDTVALSSFTSMEYTLSIKQGSKIRSSKVLVHTDGTSVDSTEYGIMEMGGGITGILVTASVSSTNAILQVTITDAATTNATVKLIKTML